MQLLDNLVAAICRAAPDCLVIYRFGSWGTGAQRDDSDIDLAFLATSSLESVVRWDLAQKLALIADRDVDLVDLLSASTVLAMQVVGYGERLYCRSEPEIDAYENLVFSRYVRFNEERRLIIEDVRERGNIYGG